MQHPRRAIVLLVVLGLCLAATPEAIPQEEAPPTPVPVGEIAGRAEATEARLAAILADLPGPGLEAEVEALLSEVAADLTVLEQRIDSKLARRPMATELETLSTSWHALDERLASRAWALGERASQLEASLEETRGVGTVWDLTRKAARSASAPKAVLLRVDEVRAGLASTLARVERARNEVLDLQSRVLDRHGPMEPVMARIDDALGDLASSLLVQQDEPFWSLRFGAEDLRRDFGVVATDFVDIGTELADYAERYRERFVFHVVLILALGWILSRARRVIAEAPPEAGSGRSSGDAVQHPWAAALVIGPLLTAFVHPERVVGLQLFAGVILAPAWVAVLAGILPAALRKALVGLAGLALLEVLQIAGSGSGLPDRGLLTLNLAAASAGFLLVRRRLRPANGWLRLLDGWLLLAGAGSALGLAATLLGYTSLASRIAFTTVWGSMFAGSWLAVARISEALAEAAVDAGWLDRLRMVRANHALVVRISRNGVRVLALLMFGSGLLSSLQLWDPFRSAGAELLSARVGFGSVGITLGGLLAFGLTLWLSWLLSRLVSFFLDQEVFPRVRMPSGVPFALATFSRYAILVVGFLVAMGTLGFSMDRVTLLVSALGVGIGFGLQNVINNFVSGIILLFERPLRVGDRVQIEDLVGVVSTIGIRASKVRTVDGADVIVPNGEFVSARVINWTLADQTRRISLPVGVAYGTKPRQVLEILAKLPQEHPEILDDPPPEALFVGFGDSSLDFELRAFTTDVQRWKQVRSDLALATSEALEAANIQIPFPQRDLHLKNLGDLGQVLRDRGDAED
jgi:small-conductance mechanosensitive channel